MSKVLLGFTVPDGEPFYIPLAHTVFTGLTQHGKTTTVEAALKRSKSKALVFLTKRGEKTFLEGHRLRPYYRERFDWEYVRGLLEASMKERLKFETPWIIRICKRANSLEDVRRFLGRLLLEKKLREFDKNIYTLLAAYLDKVLPVLREAKWKFTETLNLEEGLNVMDLTDWYVHEEVQMLVIRSCMEHILKNENNVIIGLPEAWKMLPQSRNTPVKLYFEKFIREGATNGNYLYIDAQDLGGVDKTPLRQVSVWVMGKMMEANEVERLIKQTLGLKVKAQEIQTLPLGHFIVATGKEVTKIYVWPDGVPMDLAVAVAKGELKPEVVKEWLKKKQEKLTSYLATPFKPTDYLARVAALEKRIDAISRRIDTLQKTIANTTLTPGFEPGTVATTLQKTIYEVDVKTVPKQFNLTDETVQGKVMWLAKEGFLNAWRSQSEIEKALTARAWKVTRIALYKALKQLVKQGFLGERKTDRMQYKLSPNVRFKE